MLTSDVDTEVLGVVLKQSQHQMWTGLPTSTSLGIQRSTYLRWFAPLSHISRRRLCTSFDLVRACMIYQSLWGTGAVSPGMNVGATSTASS